MMSASQIPNESSSQFLISELNDGSSLSSEDEGDIETKSSEMSQMRPSASGENVRKSVSQEIPEDYEKKTIIKITDIKRMAEQLEQQINGFSREQLQEQSKMIEETLIQNTLALDNTDTKNLDSIKELRKNTIVYIQDCLKLLDSKLK